MPTHVSKRSKVNNPHISPSDSKINICGYRFRLFLRFIRLDVGTSKKNNEKQEKKTTTKQDKQTKNKTVIS
jgi:hypothetical protein